MPYTATKMTANLKCTDAIDGIGAWAIGPTNFAQSKIPAPNLFCFLTSNTTGPATAMNVLNGSDGQGQATRMNAPDDSADTAKLYQNPIVPNSPVPTILQTQFHDGHNQMPDGFYEPQFGPAMDSVLIQTSNTNNGSVQVYVLYGAPNSPTIDAYQTCYPPPSPTNPQSLPPQGYTTPISSSDAPNYVFRVGDYTGNYTNDLYCIRTANTASGNVEVTILNGWSFTSSGSNFYGQTLLNSAQINVPDAANASTSSTANDYRWLVSKYGGSGKASLYAVKVRNLRQQGNPGDAVELYQADFSKGQLNFLDFLQIKDKASGVQHDADYAYLNFHWVMSDFFGLYGINTHNADNPDQNNVEVWKFKPQTQ